MEAAGGSEGCSPGTGQIGGLEVLQAASDVCLLLQMLLCSQIMMSSTEVRL